MAWNGSNSAEQPANGRGERLARPHKAQGIKHGLVAGLIIVALGGAALWFFTRPAPKAPAPKESKKPAAIKEVTPAPAPKADPVTVSATNVASRKMYRGHVIVSETVKTNGNILITERVTADGQVLRRIGKKNQRIFETASDELLAMAVQMKPGAVMPPMPPMGGITKADFLKSLEKPIIILHTDSDEVAELKRRVIQARMEMKAALDEGRDFSEVLRDVETRHNDAAEMTQQVRTEYRKMIEEGDAETAEIFRKRSNDILKNHGAEQVESAQSKQRVGEKENGGANE